MRVRVFSRIGLSLLLIAMVAAGDRAAAADRFKPFRLKALDGTEKTLADVLGRATLVVFFFPTCPFCNAAFPEVQRLHDAYKDDGLAMVWINVVPQEEPLIAAWQTSHRYTVPVLLGGQTVLKEYRLTMTPTHFLLDSRGNVLERRAGYKRGDERKLERDIREALQKP